MQSFVMGGILMETAKRIVLAAITMATGAGFHSAGRILALVTKSGGAEKQ